MLPYYAAAAAAAITMLLLQVHTSTLWKPVIRMQQWPLVDRWSTVLRPAAVINSLLTRQQVLSPWNKVLSSTMPLRASTTYRCVCNNFILELRLLPVCVFVLDCPTWTPCCFVAGMSKIQLKVRRHASISPAGTPDRYARPICRRKTGQHPGRDH